MPIAREGSRLRVLLLAQWYEPIIGGEEVQVRTLAHSLARRGHRVTVAALSHPERPSDYMDGDVHVYRIRAALQRIPALFADSARQSAPPFPDPAVSVALRRIVARERPDVVHAHNWMVNSYLPVRERAVPLILTLHDYSLVCAKKVLLYRRRECLGPAPAKCLRCAGNHYGPIKGAVTVAGLWAMAPALRRSIDCFITVSQAVATKNGFGREGVRSVVIPNFLPDDFEAIEDLVPEGLPNEAFLMFAGSLSSIKGIGPLLSAYVKVDKAQRPPLLLMGYTGSETLGILRDPPAGVTIITDQPRSRVAAAWRRSLIALVPSITPEAFGLTALEAMAFGRPVIASRIGGLQELIADEESGLLVEPGNASALSDAISRLLGDDELRIQLGRGAQLRSRDFYADRVVPRIERLYREVIIAKANQ